MTSLFKFSFFFIVKYFYMSKIKYDETVFLYRIRLSCSLHYVFMKEEGEKVICQSFLTVYNRWNLI